MSRRMPMTTPSTEGFYRSQVQVQASSSTSRTNTHTHTSTTTGFSEGTDGKSVNLATTSGSGPVPVQPQTMDRVAVLAPDPSSASAVATTSAALPSVSGGTFLASTPNSGGVPVTRSGTTRPGALRPPNELGRREETAAGSISATEIDAPNTLNRSKSPGIHPRSIAVRKRTKAAIRASMTQAASALSAAALAAAKEKTQADDPSMLCSLTYRGMEVIFASTHSPQWRIYGVCARTRLVFQSLDLPTQDVTNTHHHQQHAPASASIPPRIVSVMANQTSGLIAIAMSDGTIQTYQPTLTDPATHPFGRYRWVNGATIRCSRVFYQSGEKMAFVSRRHAQPGQSIELSSSRDQKLLVAHRNQLAVFDVDGSHSQQQQQHTVSSTTRPNEQQQQSQQVQPAHTEQQQQQQTERKEAQLLWTTSTDTPIVTTAMSGDGEALAVVVHGAKPGGYDVTCGVRIFLRDKEDGSLLEEDIVNHNNPGNSSGGDAVPLLQRTESVGILYKDGPFLDHSEPVTRVSFRGLGHNIASNTGVKTEDELGGNDLLLTHSKHDNNARIFNQQFWNKLIQWTTPANTRVDWVRGAAAFSLGDLETQKRLVSSANSTIDSKPPSRSPSSQALAEEAGINANNSGFGGLFQQGGRQLLHNTSPSSAAGAWIAETTFSGAFPAVRLSRLSFLKRGSETMYPALFESVASILPAGSMNADIVLNAGDESLSIHGIWPAWNPWLSETSDVHSEETLSGSAMSFLGLSSGPTSGQGGNFGEGILGGTHSPPNELRIVASHALCGNVVVMEFPLWGNRELGELELGNVTRYLLSLPDIEQQISAKKSSDDCDETMNNRAIHRLSASTDFESHRLVAKIRPDSISIALSWHKQGTMSICPTSWGPHDYKKTLKECAMSQSFGELGIAEIFRDRSLLPAPLSLPPVFLPRSVVSISGGESVQTVLWWPDENFGGPPLLVVITSTGTLLVFEVPPPWSAHEPPMPSDDPFDDFGGSVKGVDSVGSAHELSVAGTGVGIGTATESGSDDDGGWTGQKEYDVMITPDPDFGLGLRLESQLDGMPAIAGSYKKHPLTGGRLPAEKVGMIVLGDELLSVDGVRLEGISFDEIIATVRQVGASAGPGKPLSMRFRHVNGRRRRTSHDVPDPMAIEVQTSDGSRRTMEQMLGVSPNSQERIRANNSATSSVSSGTQPASPHVRGCSIGSYNLATKSSPHDEVQQEFCRLVGVARKLFPVVRSGASKAGTKEEPSYVLLPWTTGTGVPLPVGLRAAALVFYADGCKIFARRLELSSDCNPDSATVRDLGSFDLVANDVPKRQKRAVQCMSPIQTGTESRCLAVHDNLGTIQLIFASLEEDKGIKESKSEKNLARGGYIVTFRHYGIFKFGDNLHENCVVRASSIDLLATMRWRKGEFPTVTVWTARPHPAGEKHGDYVALSEYVGADLQVGSHKDLVDLCFVESGFLDSFPLLAAFARTEVVLFQKLAGWLKWNPIRVVSYACVPGSGSELLAGNCCGSSNPLDSFPHLIPCLRSIIDNSDEVQFLRTDWHPDSLIARLYTDSQGPNNALKHQVASYFFWLANSLSDEDNYQDASGSDDIGLSSLAYVHLRQPYEDGYTVELTKKEPKTSIKDLFAKEVEGASNEDEAMLRKLQSVLAAGFSQSEYKRKERVTKLNEQAVSLPSALKCFTADELRMLWALGEVVLANVDFMSVDRNGEFFILSSELLRKVKELPKPEDNENGRKHSEPMHTFSFKRRTSRPIDTTDVPEQLPSAATFFALISNSQTTLVESCRSPAGLTWSLMKEYNMPFWIRSDLVLARLSEEAGQSSFRAKRDILECALFFIIAKKHRTLRNLAATDQNDSGRKFFSFITSHDFSGERGRRAAEKNAYSLLRKRRYTVAAAFFLLAEPPFLKSSLEVIATQLQDLNLAFLVARLVESPDVTASSQRNSALAGGLGFSGGLMGMGGGGGYASSFGATPNKPALNDKVESFSSWKPRLGSGSRNLLLDRGLSLSADDNCLTAVQLMWLDQRDEASFWLSGLARDRTAKSELPDVGDDILPIAPDRSQDTNTLLSSPKQTARPSLRACVRVNALVNFVSGPILLEAISASPRPRFASALVVARTLMRCGIETTSVRAVLERCDKNTEDAKETMPPQKHFNAPKLRTRVEGSSVFDSYDVAPQRSNAMPASSEMTSSIFDSFDAPPRTTHAINSRVPQLSVFDDFNATPPTKATTQPSSGTNSSIFDSFHARRPPTSENHGQMHSSIFDDFSAAPLKKPTGGAVPQSSIFDAFDGPPAKPAQANNFANSGTAPSGIKTVQLTPDARTSSIFDAFDGPPGTAKKVHAKQVTGQSSGESNQSPAPKEEQQNILSLVPCELPKLWHEWREQVLLYASARRLIRELACLMVELHGDAFDPPVLSFSKDKDSLLPRGAAEILQLPCEGELILDRVRDLVAKIASSHGMHKPTVVEVALRFLAVPRHHNRMFYAVLLHLSNERGDLAEDLLRDAAHLMMNRCDAMALANDPPLDLTKTCSHMSSLYLRQHAARLSWQIELCLWLHRGGALPLSGIAINESIVAVRVGFAIASWNRNYECLETMMKSDPDCHMDDEAGRQHWTSLKIIPTQDSRERSTGKASSGGWEFLVDCRRSEATDLLRHKQTGCFIIRPHVEDHGVFTLSFKTNLVPTNASPPPSDAPVTPPLSEGSEQQESDKPPRPKHARPVKKDDVVQHAIIRLSDSGFRCGSFGPFGTLMKLLEAVSASLPFELRFDQPPAERVIKDEGSQPSPNAVFLRKLALRNADSMVANPPSSGTFQNNSVAGSTALATNHAEGDARAASKVSDDNNIDFRQSVFGLFLELLILSTIRKTLSGITCSKHEEPESHGHFSQPSLEETVTSHSQDTGATCFDEEYACSARMLRSFLAWCRVLELNCDCEMAPGLRDVLHAVASPQITLSASETAIEAIEEDTGRGDSIIRRMIQPNSGVDFRTLRLADGGDSTVVVLFSKKEAKDWLMKFGSEKTKDGALEKLEAMERIRVIEPIDLSRLQLKAYSAAQKGAKPEEDTGVRYRIVDPWEVEALESREGETKSAAIGRERFLAFSLGKVAIACENIFRQIGGLSALELWTSAKGGVALTKAIASVHPPWERGEGGDMQFVEGVATEPTPFSNSIRQHLYRNCLFRSVRLPQRFLALVQVELLDLKNLTAPGGSLSLTVYALLRLRRSDSGAPLTSKTRTLDSAATPPMKLAKSSGPNAPASWGSVVRFRFPLPEDVSCDGVSLDRNREILFKGPPCVLQLSVYERKLLIDNPLGDADVKIDGLAAGGQLEEWVPLRTGKHGINWFARIRLTLRFELMCLSGDGVSDDLAPSVGLRRIQDLSRMGGAQEDMKKSMSTPDLLSYFESMVY